MLDLFHNKNKFLSIRSELRFLNLEIERASYEMDIVLLDELMEEKRRLIASV